MKPNRKHLLVILLALAALSLVPGGALGAELPAEEAALAERMATLVFQIAIILLAAWAGAAACKKLRLPIVLGELAAGVVIGPYLLGAVHLPGFPAGLFALNGGFPVSYELYSFATVASIVLLFLIGLETDLNTFIRYSLAGSAIGIGGIAASFVLGDLAAVWFSSSVFGVHFGFADPVPLFFGVIATATSVGLSATILTEKQKLDSPEGVTILSAAIIDDILGIILLAIIIGMIKSGGIRWIEAVRIGGKAIGVWLIFMFLGLFFARKIGAGLKRFKETNTIVVMSFALALLVAGIFEKSGLAMIIGAYITGLSLSRTDLTYLIQANLSVLYRFFVPVFFCVMGMLIDIRVIFDGRILLFALAYALLAAVGKLVGCGLPALAFNFNLRGAGKIGAGMIMRGEVALIIAGIGLSSGVLPSEAFSAAVLMTFLTILIAPPVFSRILENGGEVLRKPARKVSGKRRIDYVFPNRETGELLLARIITAFRNEGFFVNLLDIRRHLYGIRRDESFITMEFSPKEIVFTCREEDAAFIHTLFYEALAELQRVMRQLQTLTDRKAIGKRIFEETARPGRVNGKERARLSRLFTPNGVECSLQGETKEKIIEELVDLFIASGQIPTDCRKEILQSLLDREKDLSTGLQDGIAFPHGRTGLVEKMITVAGVQREGVEFGSLDGKPARIFIATLIPANQPEPYLKMMAVLSRFLSRPENRDRLLECRSNRGLYEILREPA
ncbi:MAG: cation:proton antiporter [Candidatus Erginobacter occultus]|nr:cation:proton antiporter [Candidatus Erginobacter occultus]